jgi:putative membrane protein
VLVSVSFAQESGTVDPSKLTAEQFVSMAASSDMFEIQSSEEAQQKAQKQEVKDFAQHMIKDHTASSQKLKAAAQQAGYTPPTSMAARQAAQLTELTTGSDFDSKYAQQQLKAHQDAVAMFEAYSANGDNEPLKSFAAETLPTLREHLEEAQALQ